MAVLISHSSALVYWRIVSTAAAAGQAGLQYRAKATADARIEFARQLARTRDNGKSLRELTAQLAHSQYSPPGITFPIQTLVATTSLASRYGDYEGHLWTGDLPGGSFVRYDDHYLISTPEFCFLQMSTRLSLPKLIELGFELCGTYAVIERATLENGPAPTCTEDLRPASESNTRRANETSPFAGGLEKCGVTRNGKAPEQGKERTVIVMDNAFRSDCFPAFEEHEQTTGPHESFMLNRDYTLTSTEKLSDFLGRCAGAHGIKQAQRALQFIIDSSASPRETDVAMMLSLPYRLGGYGLPAPKLNYSVAAKPKGGRGKRQFSCDACWPEAQVALEYESNEHHLEEKKFASDSHRRSLIESSGMTVFTLTNREVRDGGAFNEFAHALAKRLGKRLRYTDPAFTRAHLALRRELRL